MNSLKFERTNGNVPKSLAGKDHVSGLIYYLGTGEVAKLVDKEGNATFSNGNIQPVSTIEMAEKLGIKADESLPWNIRNLHYQLSEIFRINPGISLYVGLYEPKAGQGERFEEIRFMQNYAGGEIRQLGIWNGTAALLPGDLTEIQRIANKLETDDTPISVVLYAPKVTDSMNKNLAGSNQNRVAVVIGQDGAGVAKTLQDANGNATVSGLGVVLGLVSKAKVHECIGWVQKFPTGISLPAFGDGTLCRTVDKGTIEALDSARYIFFRTYSGLNGSYVNDSHNMDSAISDYNTIELVRTMDKAVRGIRTYLLPELGSPLYLDPETGKLAPETVKHLETVANKQLDDMTKAGELSGYVVEIDPDQNVASTSTVEFVIKNVAVGVFRTGNVKIGFAQHV